MKELLVLLRSMQMFAHSAHHLVARAPFHADHEFFSSVYKEAESDFDGVAERIIGTMGEEHMELSSLMMGVMANLKGAPSVGVKENSSFYMFQLALEDKLCALVASIVSQDVSPGIEQLVGDICNRAEMRKYKIKQRLKK